VQTIEDDEERDLNWGCNLQLALSLLRLHGMQVPLLPFIRPSAR